MVFKKKASLLKAANDLLTVLCLRYGKNFSRYHEFFYLEVSFVAYIQNFSHKQMYIICHCTTISYKISYSNNYQL